ALVRKTLSPHTTGEEWARPGTLVLQSTFSPLAMSHFTGVGAPSPTPRALGPRKPGQLVGARSAALVATESARPTRRTNGCRMRSSSAQSRGPEGRGSNPVRRLTVGRGR